MNKNYRGILVGMILGDGYLLSQGNHCSLTIEHSQKQIEYLKHKAKLIHSIFGGKPCKIYRRSRYDKRTNKIYKQCSLAKGNKYFKFLKKKIYCNKNKKYYTRSVLNWLTPHGLAIWYMDDGCCKARKNKNGNITSCQTYLNTYCSLEEAQTIKTYFKEVWNIDFSIHTRKLTKTCLLCANSEASKKFIKLIRPYIIPQMQYKLRHVI